MAVYAVTGKLGSGKGKGVIQRLREYLRQGKRVATNCDVFLDHLMPPLSKATVTRIPDKPSLSDLYAIGSGNKFIHFETRCTSTNIGFDFVSPEPRILDGFDEAHNGALILDECASWLNTRNFQDKGRAGLLEWAIHARKYGWDVYFVCQNIRQIDAQLRESLFEYVVRMNRLDRMKVPFVSAGIKLMTFGASSGALPRMHIGVVRLGSNPDGLVADRWVFRGDDLNKGYNTTQVFSDSYPHGIHTVLSSWHLSARCAVPDGFVGPVRPGAIDQVLIKGRADKPKGSKNMMRFVVGAALFGVAVGAFAMHVVGARISTSAQVAKVHHYSDTVTGRGFLRKDRGVVVILSDGRTLSPMAFNTLPVGWEAQISDDLWIKGAQ